MLLIQRFLWTPTSIERAMQLKKVYEKIEKENLGKQVKFGLVAFRSSTKAVPGLEYTSKMFVDPSTVKDGKDFMDKVANLKTSYCFFKRI